MRHYHRLSLVNEINTGHLGMGNIFGAVALEAAYSKGEEWLGQLLQDLQGNLDLLSGYI